MTEVGPDLVLAHRPELAARIEELAQHLDRAGADEECGRRAHALKGAALTLGLDGLAVAAAALEAACDDEGGDPQAAVRAVEAGRRAVAGDGADEARIRHDLRGGLNIVVGHASLLELEPLTPKQRDSVGEILAAADMMAAVLNEAEAAARPLRGRPPAVAGPTRRVLLVEDDHVTASMVSRMLSELGAEVSIARAAADAVALAVRERPDIVLLDLGLPDGDGREVLRSLRAVPELEGVPVVVSSGESGAALGRELAERGAAAILPKPVTMDALRSLLADVAG